MHSASGALDGYGIALAHEFYKHRVAIGSQPRIAHRQPSQAVVEAQLVVAFAQGITSCDNRVTSDRDATRALDLQAVFGNRYWTTRNRPLNRIACRFASCGDAATSEIANSHSASFFCRFPPASARYNVEGWDHTRGAYAATPPAAVFAAAPSARPRSNVDARLVQED